MNLPGFFGALPRAVALDLDGTTLNSNSEMAPRTAGAIRALAQTGMPMLIATARPARVLPKLIGADLLSVLSVVQMNGALANGVPPLTNEVANPIPPGQARLCWDMVNELEPAARMTMELDGHRFAVNHDDDVEALWNLNSATPAMVIPTEEALATGPAKVSVNGLGLDLGDLLVALVRELDDDIDVIPADNNGFVNVVHSSATKEGAVRDLLAPTGIGLEDVLAFGDDFPDKGILGHCGWPVAVANAIPEIRSLAKYGTASNDDHGVAIVLEGLAKALTSRAT